MLSSSQRYILTATLAAASLLAQTSVEAPIPADARDRVFYPGDTESLKPLGRKLARNVWLDQKEIWTSPFRVKKNNAKLWIGFGAATAALVATDRRTSNTFENSTGQVRWANRVSNIGSTYTVLPVIAGFYGIGVLEDKPKLRETGVLSAEAVIDSLLVVEILKPVVGRNRPNSRIERGNFFDDGGDSFPSGHSISSWALASVISHEYSGTKWVPFVAYGLASTVSAARFAAQKHYASDVFAGAAIGWFIGDFVYRTHLGHGLHKHAWLSPTVSPEVQPISHTYALSLTLARLH